MAKKKNKLKQVKRDTVAKSLPEIEQSRTGGQIALSGFDYQCLYSCYLILNFLDNNKKIRFEGIEDIDSYILETDSLIEHIQLKYSTLKQDASFLKDVLKNYLEIYLCDKSRKFKMVFDFSIAKGNLKKLIDSNMDEKSTEYWNKIIDEIRVKNLNWNWQGFDSSKFFSSLNFEYFRKESLMFKIEQLLILKYDVATGNERLVANALLYLCFTKMKDRSYLNKEELDGLIQSIKDDINKGAVNPAHNWIEKINFDNLPLTVNNLQYYEGKKATPSDIVQQLPIRRKKLEEIIQNSISYNNVTIIKSSSGQGKTTLAWQVAYNLKNEYSIYQLTWCNDAKELNNIIEYFKSRIKIGEKVLIVLDNLDNQFKEWNRLAQYIENRIGYNYKILITTREDDWYNYSGDQSNIKNLNVINIFMDATQAKEIFFVLKKANKLHPKIRNWQSSWEQVSNRKLLIEYIYLLTHGVMLSDRIYEQIKNLQKSYGSKIKCEILRKICLADILGIKLPVNNLLKSLTEKTDLDIGELLKSIENEFFIKLDERNKYVEGLHPVRSQHIVDELHRFVDIIDTTIELMNIVDQTFVGKLFTSLPMLININKNSFYRKLIEQLWDKQEYAYFLEALQGIFSGSVLQYYQNNKNIFDNANEHGGLFLFAAEVNPYANFEEFNVEIKTLSEMKRIDPENKNILYLNELVENIEVIDIKETDVYLFAINLYEKIQTESMHGDIKDLVKIAYWFINLDKSLNLSNKFNLQYIWNSPARYENDTLANLMYCYFLGSKESYLDFVKENKKLILRYLKKITKSMQLFESDDGLRIHVNYILLPEDIASANDESMCRLNLICKTLPIYDVYCASAIKPQISFLCNMNLPDDSHKEIPLQNIVITFHQDFTSLWSKTILSNYEYSSIYEWINDWFDIRRNIILLLDLNVKALDRLLLGKALGKELANNIDNLRQIINKFLIQEHLYPHEDRPFEEKPEIPNGLEKVKHDYFTSISNYFNQMVGLMLRDSEKSRLAMVNLYTAKSKLKDMQKYFSNVLIKATTLAIDNEKICDLENRAIEQLIKTNEYYISHDPSKYYNHLIINSWVKQQKSEMMKKINSCIAKQNINYDIIFPIDYIQEGVLKSIPFIVKEINFEDSIELTNLLLMLTVLSDFNFQYVILLSCNNEDVSTNALKINTSYLKAFKEAYESDDATKLDNLVPPLPIEINEEIFKCFHGSFNTTTVFKSCYEGIDSLYTMLWEYSQYAKHLDDEDDKIYLKELQEKKKREIDKVLKKLKTQVPQIFFDKLECLKEETIEKEVYLSEEKLNALFNELILIIKNLE
ncbi:hypothetical protein A0J52_06845 [Clostridium sporogenes]|uniref:P-loop NTPase n=1 Tax=Clostridium sporogenes TaxID=1509 RepID=UPI00077FECE5|nr:hypothetical protein [Clostridium sporogenes]KYN78987.1 hypothetical protein A0J52_06845 [Clostridium sporogenes]MBW5459319.1 hypothetical protein [Clostridium sporogenes]